MNLQTAFNKIWKHFQTMEVPSAARIGSSFDCFYRGPNNSRCFVGVLIPNRLYHKAIEQKTPYQLCNPTLYPKADDFRTLFRGIPLSALADLQTIHDKWAEKSLPKSYVEKQLQDFAKKYDLRVPV